MYCLQQRDHGIFLPSFLPFLFFFFQRNSILSALSMWYLVKRSDFDAWSCLPSRMLQMCRLRQGVSRHVLRRKGWKALPSRGLPLFLNLKGTLETQMILVSVRQLVLPQNVVGAESPSPKADR